LLLAGWGGFNVVEGVVDHHVLRVHHVRDDVASPLPWDIGFLVFGIVLTVVGVALIRTGQRTRSASASDARRVGTGSVTNAARPCEVRLRSAPQVEVMWISGGPPPATPWTLVIPRPGTWPPRRACFEAVP